MRRTCYSFADLKGAEREIKTTLNCLPVANGVEFQLADLRELCLLMIKKP